MDTYAQRAQQPKNYKVKITGNNNEDQTAPKATNQHAKMATCKQLPSCCLTKTTGISVET